jgi:hypothetical protein
VHFLLEVGMAVTTPAIGTPGASAKAHRQAFSALAGQDVETFVNAVTAVGVGHGLVREGHLAVSEKSGTPNMSVDVAAGIAMVTGDSSLAQGVYVATNDAVANLVVATADATNDRWDLVVMQVRDNAEDSGGSTDARLFVVTGTAASSPADPTIPDGCLVLARVVVEALASSITDSDITNLAGLARGSSWNQAWGMMGYAAEPGPHAFGFEPDIPALSVTFTAVPGRLYRTSIYCAVSTSGAAGSSIAIVTPANSTIAAGQYAYSTDSEAPDAVFTIALEDDLSGSVTRKARNIGLSGELTNGIMMVEDVGPA